MARWRRAGVLGTVSMVLAGAVAGAVAGATLAAPGSTTHAPKAQRTGVGDAHWNDFNGDGFDDLAIGAPMDDVVRMGTTYPAAGVVHVLYGSATGLTSAGSQVWTQDKPGVADVAHAGDHFGASLAAGDFDGDEFGDLAIGVPDEDVQGEGLVPDFGGVNILYGGSNGLEANPAQEFVTFENAFSSSQGFRIGASLVALDVLDTSNLTGAADARGGHADGADLAIGVPGYEDGVGTVWIVGGEPLDPSATEGAQSVPPFLLLPGCRIGTSLAAGEFDADVRDDLAVGGPGCHPNDEADSGSVFVVFNGSTVERLSQDAGFLNVPEPGDRLGASVAVGDVNGDGIDDLIGGAPGEDLQGKADAGIANVAIRNSTMNGWGFPTLGDFTRKRMGGANVAGARFGASLATGEAGESGNVLYFGAPGDTVNGRAGAGTVWIRYGSTIGKQRWSQDSAGVLDAAESSDGFGYSLAVGHFNDMGAGGADLAIGVRNEDVGGISNAGAVNVLYAGGSAQPLTSNNDDLWTQDLPGIGQAAGAGDQFGSAVR